MRSVLASPGFTAGLALLLVNDFLLKPYLHNWLTGKLSDFAGLFVFPMFWAAAWPRARAAIYVGTAALFAIWKSPASQPIIDGWNALDLFRVGRTVDATDLLALLVLPVSYIYFERAIRAAKRSYLPYFAAVAALFAFTATSYRTEFTYSEQFLFDEPQDLLLRKIFHLGHLDTRNQVLSPCLSGGATSDFDVRFSSTHDVACFDRLRAVFTVTDEGGRGTILLKKLDHQCPEGDDDRQRMLTAFEQDYIGRLRQLEVPTREALGGSTVGAALSERAPGKLRLCFAPLGDVPQAQVKAVARRVKQQLGLSVRVLPALPLGPQAHINGDVRARYGADELVRAMAAGYPRQASDPRFVIIGFVSDMVVSGGRIIFYEFEHVSGERYAVVAVDALDPSSFCERENLELFEEHLYKVTARLIGRLYYRLPLNSDPQSLLFSALECVDVVDHQVERF